jgi:N-acetylneuraminic acid mutarotase
MKTIAYSFTFLLTIFATACGIATEGTGAAPIEPETPPGNEEPGGQPEDLVPESERAPGWYSLASLARGPRTDSAVVALRGRIAVIGGFESFGDPVHDVEIYDPATDKWDVLPSLPKPLHHASAGVVDGNLYVLGGLQSTDNVETGESYVFYPNISEWRSIASMPAGSERAASAVGVIGTTIYIAGGLRDGAPVADFSAYDTVGDTWQELPALPEARGELVGGVVGGVFYAMGGRTLGSEKAAIDVFAFDPAKGQWSSRAAMPTARFGCAAGVVGDRIFVLGGKGETSGVFDINEVYDPATDTWETGARMTAPRHAMGVTGYEGALYVSGGSATELLGVVDTFEAYIPE